VAILEDGVFGRVTSDTAALLDGRVHVSGVELGRVTFNNYLMLYNTVIIKR